MFHTQSKGLSGYFNSKRYKRNQRKFGSNQLSFLHCNFCNKNFRSEKRYVAHQCEEFKTNAIFTTLEGKAAFIYYNEWKKAMNLPESSTQTFIRSRFYSAFLKFAKFAMIKMLPDKNDYIKFMVSKIIPPVFWYDEDFYNLYISDFEKKTLEYKIKISLLTLEEISLILDCDIRDIYLNLRPVELIRLIVNKKISPWLLVPSKKFHNFIKDRCNNEELILLSSILKLSTWKKVISENHQDYIFCKKIIDQYNI
jgi:hypothetical protein